MIVVEALIKVDFPIAIQIMKYGKLIATREVDPVSNHLQTERLIESRSNALPLENPFVAVHANVPNIAIPSANRHAPVGVEIEARESHLCQPRIRLGSGQYVDRKRTLVKRGRCLGF